MTPNSIENLDQCELSFPDEDQSGTSCCDCELSLSDGEDQLDLFGKLVHGGARAPKPRWSHSRLVLFRRYSTVMKKNNNLIASMVILNTDRLNVLARSVINHQQYRCGVG